MTLLFVCDVLQFPKTTPQEVRSLVDENERENNQAWIPIHLAALNCCENKISHRTRLTTHASHILIHFLSKYVYWQMLLYIYISF